VLGLGRDLAPHLQKRQCDGGGEERPAEGVKHSWRSGRASWRRRQLRAQPWGCSAALGHSSRHPH